MVKRVRFLEGDICATNVDSNKRRHRTNVVLKKSYFEDNINTNNVDSNKPWLVQTLIAQMSIQTNVD